MKFWLFKLVNILLNIKNMFKDIEYLWIGIMSVFRVYNIICGKSNLSVQKNESCGGWFAEILSFSASILLFLFLNRTLVLFLYSLTCTLTPFLGPDTEVMWGEVCWGFWGSSGRVGISAQVGRNHFSNHVIHTYWSFIYRFKSPSHMNSYFCLLFNYMNRIVLILSLKIIF